MSDECPDAQPFYHYILIWNERNEIAMSRYNGVLIFSVNGLRISYFEKVSSGMSFCMLNFQYWKTDNQ